MEGSPRFQGQWDTGKLVALSTLLRFPLGCKYISQQLPEGPAKLPVPVTAPLLTRQALAGVPLWILLQYEIGEFLTH
jgi:hypothetical protein